MASDELPAAVREFFRGLGKYGHLGGKKAAENMTPAARKRRAKKAAKASVEARRSKKEKQGG